MNKIIALLLTVALTLSLAACTSRPSDEKIKAALDEGTITVEDAKSKGWIDDAWVNANYESIEAKSKIHLFTEFETTYLDGTAVSSDIIEGKMCLAFFDTQKDGAPEKLAELNKIAIQMEEIGVPLLGIVMDKDLPAASEKLADMKFPIITYNEAMQQSLSDYTSLLDTDVTTVFTKEGGFYTAWNSAVDTKKLLSFAQSLADET